MVETGQPDECNKWETAWKQTTLSRRRILASWPNSQLELKPLDTAALVVDRYKVTASVNDENPSAKTVLGKLRAKHESYTKTSAAAKEREISSFSVLYLCLRDYSRPLSHPISHERSRMEHQEFELLLVFDDLGRSLSEFLPCISVGFPRSSSENIQTSYATEMQECWLGNSEKVHPRQGRTPPQVEFAESSQVLFRGERRDRDPRGWKPESQPGRCRMCLANMGRAQEEEKSFETYSTVESLSPEKLRSLRDSSEAERLKSIRAACSP